MASLLLENKDQASLPMPGQRTFLRSQHASQGPGPPSRSPAEGGVLNGSYFPQRKVKSKTIKASEPHQNACPSWERAGPTGTVPPLSARAPESRRPPSRPLAALLPRAPQTGRGCPPAGPTAHPPSRRRQQSVLFCFSSSYSHREGSLQMKSI